MGSIVRTIPPLCWDWLQRNVMTRSIQDILSEFSASPFSIDVPGEFVTRFFDQRRLIAETTKAFYKSKKRSESDTIDHRLLYDGTDIWGQSTIEENFALHSIVRVLKPRRVLEIGLFRGQTAMTLNQSLTEVGGGDYVGVDISQDTLNIVTQVLEKAGLNQRAQLILGNSAEVLSAMPSVDLAFIDGDHSWPAVVRDVANVYNKQAAGGVIAMHDVGTPGWGWCLQDPGRLLHDVLPERLAGHATIFWLDSMCRQLTMKLLSPVAKGPHTYFSSIVESLEKARVTTYDTVKGWGGLGFILKSNENHQLDIEDLLRAQPAPLNLNPAAVEKPVSLLGRIARKLASKVP